MNTSIGNVSTDLRAVVAFLCVILNLAIPIWVRAAGTSGQNNYDAEITKAISAPDNFLALDLLSRMLDDAKGIAVSDGDTAAALCDKAYDLATRKPGLQDKAIEVLETASHMMPDLADEYQSRAINAMQRRCEDAKLSVRASVGEPLLSEIGEAAGEAQDAGRLHHALDLYLKAGEIAKSFKSPKQADIGGHVKDLKVKISDQQKVADAIGVLTGTQQQDFLELPTRNRPYIIQGDYLVPSGKMLKVEEGNTILFDDGGQLTVLGRLQVNGYFDDDVYLRGARPGVDAWKGLLIKESKGSELRYAKIGGAEIGLDIAHCDPKAYGCVFADDGIGVRVGGYGSGSNPAFQQCVFSFNRSHGIDIAGSSAELNFCTITRNGGWGINGVYYASPHLNHCIVTGNTDGGIACHHYKCKAEAHQSVIAGNKGFDLDNAGASDWDFSGNWWGDAATAVLKQNGDTATVPGITGSSKVIVSGYLDRIPSACGARLQHIGERRLY